MLGRESSYRDRQLGSLYYNPEAECTVYLERRTGTKKLTTITRNINKNNCVSRVVSWVDIANYTLDISLFSIFHKDIITAIIKRQTRGVMCRVIVFKNLMMGEKRLKNEDYVKKLKKAGVQIRWISKTKCPPPPYRLVLIDCTDPTGRPLRNDNDMGVVYGEQVSYKGYNQITNDMFGLMVMKSPPNDMEPWSSQFEELWASLDSDSEFIPSESEEANMNVAGSSSFFGRSLMAKKR